MRLRSLLPLTTTCLLLYSGCRDQQIRSYRIAKETAPPPLAALPAMSPHGTGAGMPAPTAEPTPSTSLTWTAPATWTPKALGQMRKGSYAVPGADNVAADLSITMFPAAANPLLANVNRWRGQVGLGPITEAQLPAETTALENGAYRFTVVDLAAAPSGGAAANRILGAVLYLGDEAWFFKLSGPDAAVASQKPAFLDFLKTVNAR